MALGRKEPAVQPGVTSRQFTEPVNDHSNKPVKRRTAWSPVTTEATLSTRIKKRYLAIFIALALTALACGTGGKTNYQIAQEAVDCMLRNNPEDGFGIMIMGGKDAYAKVIEQSMSRPSIVEFRNQNCEDNTP